MTEGGGYSHEGYDPPLLADRIAKEATEAAVDKLYERELLKTVLLGKVYSVTLDAMMSGDSIPAMKEGSNMHNAAKLSAEDLVSKFQLRESANDTNPVAVSSTREWTRRIIVGVLLLMLILSMSYPFIFPEYFPGLDYNELIGKYNGIVSTIIGAALIYYFVRNK